MEVKKRSNMFGLPKLAKKYRKNAVLPEDIIRNHIFPLLSLSDTIIFCRTCKEYQNWLDDKTWERLYSSEFPVYPRDSSITAKEQIKSMLPHRVCLQSRFYWKNYKQPWISQIFENFEEKFYHDYFSNLPEMVENLVKALNLVLSPSQIILLDLITSRMENYYNGEPERYSIYKIAGWREVEWKLSQAESKWLKLKENGENPGTLFDFISSNAGCKLSGYGWSDTACREGVYDREYYYSLDK